ncbi:MAG: hypothetical protein U1D55_08810 [Phycisphaerae bacterium]
MNPETLSRLDAYLDGLLDADARRDFERELLGDAGLREQVTRQRAIDASLKRGFAAPSAEALLARVLTQRPKPAPPKPAPPRVIRLFGPAGMAVAAAVLLISVGSSWYLWQTLSSSVDTGPLPIPVRPLLAVAAAYQEALDNGFKPFYPCRSDQELAGTIYKQLNQGLLWANIPTNVSLLGLIPTRVVSQKTIMMLARVDGKPVVLLIDRACDEKAPPSPPPPESGLKMFRSVVGELVLYEVTPLDKPSLLDFGYDPKKPEEWYLKGAW